jgi:hypothetical protein
MANPQRGETVVEVDGQVYTFKAGINTLRIFEGVLTSANGGKKVTWQDGINDVNAGRITEACALLWSMLREHHPTLTMDAVGDLVGRMGLATINQKFEETLRAAYPDPDLLRALGIDPNPPKAQEKSGAGVTSLGALDKPPAWAETKSGRSRSRKSSKSSSSRATRRKPNTVAIA